MLSITTDYAKSTGNPEPSLRRIATAGFSHIHWCHHWNTDFLYSTYEIAQIARWLQKYGLRLLDLHASQGREKNWGSLREYARLSGIELVKNRITMAAELGSNVIILHLPDGLKSQAAGKSRDRVIRQSLDVLVPFAQAHGVRIALENLSDANFEKIKQLCTEYGEDVLGLCYDAGHGNLTPRGLIDLEQCQQRLLAIHLHDNDGHSDQHKLPFSGTVDWGQLARIVAASSYQKCVSLEVSMKNSGIADEATFLAQAFHTGTRLANMIAECHRS